MKQSGHVYLAAGLTAFLALSGYAASATIDDDCEEYGGRFSLADEGSAFEVYPGSGEVLFYFRRPYIEGSNVVTNVVRDTEYTSDQLDEEVLVRVVIDGATPWPMHKSYTFPEIEGYTPLEDDPRVWVPEIPAVQNLYYKDVYPGVDFSNYQDMEEWEYVFFARPGADASNINIRVQAQGDWEIDTEGNLQVHLECGRLFMRRPFLHESKTAELQDVQTYQGRFSAAGSGLSFDFAEARGAVAPEAERPRLTADPELRLVSASGDTNGPPYDFHVSKFEVTNEEFVRFLNNAESNPTNRFGSNMHFDAQGNVWISPDMQSRRDEMFSVADSRIVYRRNAKEGERYAITSRTPDFGESYTNHPVTGVSWYGAVKYCNWLTLATGRELEDLCYREGTNAVDWAPITCAETNWVEGRFHFGERARWLNTGGYRLLMDNGNDTNSTGNVFNEWGKAASWGGTNYLSFGYGRTNAFTADANYYVRASLLRPDTRPVGFYDGTKHDDRFQTHTNANLFGIYDLSGNVSEWINDIGITNSPLTRAYYGGSFQEALPDVTTRQHTRPYATSTGCGFRVVSMDSRKSLLVLRVRYTVCLCGTGKREGAEDIRDRLKDETIDRGDLTALAVGGLPPGQITGVIPKPTTDEVVTPGGGGTGVIPGIPPVIPPDIVSPGEP